MEVGRGGMGSHKHGVSGYAPRSPRYKFMQQLDARREENSQRKRKPLTAKTVAEAMRQQKGTIR